MKVTARNLAAAIAYTAGAAMIAAGPVMIYEGVHGQHEVTSQLSEQLISFPAKGSAGLPAAQAGYAGQQVTTGGQAKAYADMIETLIRASKTVLARSLPMRKARVGTPSHGEMHTLFEKTICPLDCEKRAKTMPVARAVTMRLTTDSATITELARGETGYIAP